jgi:hypothetical protein
LKFTFITPILFSYHALDHPLKYEIKGKSFTKLSTILLILASNCRYHTLISALNGKPLPDFTRVSIDTYLSDRLVLPRARCGGTGIPMIRVRPSAGAGTGIRNRIKSGAVGQCMQCRNNGRCHCSQDGDHPERLIKLF